MKIVMVKPGEEAVICEIEEGLAQYQQAVEGYIEAFYPFAEEVCIICNEEGKINGMEPCRAVFDESGELADIVFGPFFLCACGGENLSSLSDEQAERYCALFRLPERFFLTGSSFTVLPYEP